MESTNAKRGAINAPSAEEVSQGYERPKDTPRALPVQAPSYRSSKRGSQGQVIWVQGKPLLPVTTPEKMARLARDHARDEWRRRWQIPADGGERAPAEHRAATQALDDIESNEKSVAKLARAIADAWEGGNDG
jgi:hypothetical protein